MKFLLTVTTLCLTGCATTPTDWTEQDRARMTAIYAVLAADAVSAARIQNTPGVIEAGFPASQLLGEKPDPAAVIALSVGLAFAYRAIAQRLPAKWRPTAQYFLLGTHTYGLATNCQHELC